MKRQPRHNWTVAEKKEILKHIKLKTPSPQVKNLMFPDDSVPVKSVYKMIQNLKKDPSYANHEPRKINFVKPTQKVSNSPDKKIKRNFTKKIHFWTPEERQIISDNIGTPAKSIKKVFFKKDKTINEKGIHMQQYYLRKGIVTVDQVSKRIPKDVKFLDGQMRVDAASKLFTKVKYQRNGHLPLEIAYFELQKIKKSIPAYMKQLSSSIASDSNSPLSTVQRNRIKTLLQEQGEIILKEKQTELVQGIN